MCGLAELLNNMGAHVTGSDMNENAQTQRLEKLGVTIFFGHHADHLGDAEVVVYSSAVKTSNPELVEARRRKIPVIRRAEALAEIMRLKRGVAIGGTHGKTTTTSLTASIFLEANLDPTIVVGGRLDVIKSTALLGQGEWLIAEADESDGSFLMLSPEIAVITNIDTDHLDHYKNFESLQRAFTEFAATIPFYGAAVVCGDDPKIRKLFSDFSKRILFYGINPDNDYVLSGRQGKYQLHFQNDLVGSFQITWPGLHNALNATAAIIVALQAGIEFPVVAKALERFKGVDRRFQHKATVRGVEFYDDYGHHPTEVRAVLAGFKERFPDRRLVVMFQPHRFSRTKLCWDEFKTCFSDADQLFLLDIYPAGESPIASVDSITLAKSMDHRNVHYVDRKADMNLSEVTRNLKEGDVFLTLGAGDVCKLGEVMMETIAKAPGRS